MFRGRFEHVVDVKGRVSLPVKYREILSAHYNNQLVITNMQDCLVAYPVQVWMEKEEGLGSQSIMEDDVQTFMHFFISGATECSVDRLGRILIPQTLRKHAELDREVVFVGMIERFEIWNKPRWEETFTEAQKNFRQVKGKEAFTKWGF
jgi:MraZ protein